MPAAQDANKAVVRRVVEAFNSGNTNIIDQVVADNFVARAGAHPGTSSDRDGLKQQIQLLHNAFPGGRYHVEELIAEGDKVNLRWRMEGTHSGEYAGEAGALPASGKQVVHHGHEVFRLENGKIVEYWGIPDNKEFEAKLR